ncbi:hypothetical protein P4S64_06215 [Vibrio sp. M60_M31a]
MTCPILVLGGTADRITPIKVATRDREKVWETGYSGRITRGMSPGQ